MQIGTPLTLEDVRAEAKRKLKGICALYRECDGAPSNLCQGQSYGREMRLGGIGSGASFEANVDALKRIRLEMRVIGQHFVPDTRFCFFGKSLSMPIMPASVAGTASFGGDEVISETGFCRAVIEGANAAGSLGWRGDSYNYDPADASYGLDAIRDGRSGGIKISKPRPQAQILAYFRKAEQYGATAVGVDVDGCCSHAMTRHKKSVGRKSVDDIREWVEATSLPVIVKGIMTAGDAVAAVEVGAKAVVVSNHGGRVLDSTPGTAEVLPDVVSALQGSDAVILADGGVRTGFDVLKMLALGADAVLMGRDIVRAAVGGGAEGVRLQLEYAHAMLVKAMLMTNCHDLGTISPQVLSE